MIITEFYLTRKDGITLYKSYSDRGFYIRQIETGNVYSEAIDVENASYTYEEIEDKIKHIEDEINTTTNTKEIDYVEYTE